MKSCLDAYQAYGTVPTRQDISNMAAHFQRRGSLYRSLGIVPAVLGGKSIIELGPGSGENSLYLASLNPAKYTLVDGTASSIRSLQNLHAHYYPSIETNIIHSDFFDFNVDEKFDAVFCEGAIPTQLEPVRLLNHIATFVKSGGVLVITCMDAVSLLPEILRRFLARRYIQTTDLNASHISRLVDFFKKDLDSLSSMSRLREDWVLDQIIHPWNGPPFSMADAIGALGDHFSAHGTSPRFFSDWRWYKSIHQEDDGFSAALLSSYHAGLHNFLDWRFSLPAVDVNSNKNLLDLSQQVYDLQFAMENGEKPLDSIPMVELLQKILQCCAHIHNDTRSSITNAIESFSSKSSACECDLAGWWGRGQQYLSFVKK